jgi:hypothetical protein
LRQYQPARPRHKTSSSSEPTPGSLMTHMLVANTVGDTGPVPLELPAPNCVNMTAAPSLLRIVRDITSS